MRVWFASGCAPYPFLRGGAEHGLHALACWLVAQGHAVHLFGSVDNYLFTVGRSLESVPRVLTERGLRFVWQSRASLLQPKDGGAEPVVTRHMVRYDAPYPVTLVEREVHVPERLEEALAGERPDVIVTQLNQASAICEAGLSANLPVVLLQPSLELGSTHPDSLEAVASYGNRLSAIVVPSAFVAGALQMMFSIPSRVVPPAIDESFFLREADPGEVRERPWITLVNPQPKKGLHLFLRLAESLSGQRFATVESWFGSPWTIRSWIESHSNVDLVPLLPGPVEVAEVYRRTRILVVPSACEEAFGRVIVEAQHGGIPVVAADRGGISEALGDGGVLLPAGADFEAWADVLERLSGDPAGFAELSRRARANAARFGLRVVGERFESILEEAAGTTGRKR